MGKKVEVEVAGMRSVADGLDSMSAKITGILDTVKAAAEAHDGCWGHDEYGDKFADGQSGYNARNPDLQKAIQSKATMLEQYSKGLRDAATKFDNTEETNKDGF
nr:type VII secretion target [Nocardia yunnanensis]